MGVDSTHHGAVISSLEDGVGMKPSDLLLLALGGCTAYDVVNILIKKRAHLTDFSITISGEQDSDPPWAFHHIHLHYVVTGHNLTEREVDKAIKLSKDKYCSVSATLAASVEITYDFEVVAAP
jgi:putative redox protein